MRLVLIRHGQTQANVEGALDTAHPGMPLNETGLAQALAIPEKWERLIGNSPKRVVASFIERAKQTAAPLAQHFGLEVEENEDLREIVAGDIEMSTKVADQEDYLLRVVDWCAGIRLDNPMPNSEDGYAVLARFDRGIAWACEGLEDDDTVAVVAHGAIMRVWAAQRSPELSADLVGQHPSPNTALTLLEGSPETGWSCSLWADRAINEWEVIPGGAPITSNHVLEN
ncbi:MAG: histidine phosphatase family protein [Actinomycetaceae bacterium]|nr:histidine phosphatase family protein [Actinomycetaceae bacterium]